MDKRNIALFGIVMIIVMSLISCGQTVMNNELTTIGSNALKSEKVDKLVSENWQDYYYTINSRYVRIDQYTGDDENAVIPEKIGGLLVTVIGDNAFYRCYALNRITIPSGVSKIGSNPFFRCSSLQEITVDEGNDHYTAENGALFNKEMTTLIAFPEGLKADSYSVPETVETIADGALGYHPACKNFRFLNKDIAFPEGALTAHDYDLTLFGYAHSSAQAYAEKYRIKFAELQE